MKKLLLFCCLIISTLAFAQSSKLKVTLKSGVVIVGEMVEFDPADHVTLKIAGKETKILMVDVKSVETDGTATKEVDNTSKNNNNILSSGQSGYYEITDNNDYPENITFTVAGQEITMVLVRGGSFNMGYDGSGSLGMKSEPVHQVNISSYYISKTCISEKTASILLGKEKKSYKDRNYSDSWKTASELVNKISDKTQKPYRLLTEAEWEYASIQPVAENIWGNEKQFEWCFDFFDKYRHSIQTNPKGPVTGNKHVIRSYRMGKNKWDRKPGRKNEIIKEAVIRIAISAEDI